MAPVRKKAMFAIFLSAVFAVSLAAPSDFEEERAFLNSLQTDLHYMEQDTNDDVDPFLAYKTTTQDLIKKYGFPCETHTVQTDDGYILELHRIPNPGKTPIFLQHGILSSSADWVVLGPQKALALVLSIAGYDVWLGNSRGSTYSRKHANLSPSDSSFWDFSWHEIGYYDLPACIDYILGKTDQKDLYYAAHSQGTTAFFVMASMRPEYNDKIRAAFAMAPIAFLNEVRSFPLRVISMATSQVGFIARMIGVNEFLPSTHFIRRIGSYLCSDHSITQSLCANALFLICGFDSDQLNKTMLPEILEHVPAGASTKQIVHFGQLITRDPVFRQYDYGYIKNLWYYGSLNPPSYDLTKVTAKVHLIYGENDLLAVPNGVSKLHKILPNSVDYHRVPYDRFNHMDFLFAKDAHQLLYGRIVEKLQNAFSREH